MVIKFCVELVTRKGNPKCDIICGCNTCKTLDIPSGLAMAIYFGLHTYAPTVLADFLTKITT